jgi:hypothetical protein
MEHISNLLNTSSLNVKREESKYDTALDLHVTDVVNKLFAFFYSICRGFEKQYQDPKRLNIEKTQWIRAFMDVGLNTLEKVQLGVKKCRIESPINTPTIGQFIKWSTPSPEELGIPRIEDAYIQACENSKTYNTKKTWSHQAVYHAWSMCNPFDLASLPKKNTFPIFERNYEITVKMIMRGEFLKEIPIAIAHDKESAPQQKVAKGFEHFNSRSSAMDAISGMLGKRIDGSIDQGRMQKNIKQGGI